jgi:DNA repair exonuclease SbcCD ATPase subunit
MIIDRINVKGEGKETATIELKKGLNVIAGASNTGKSYIVECLQFIFGASSVPKRINESKGYTSVEVSFQDNDGTTFILARELRDGAEITCTEVDKDNLKTVLKPKHTGKNNLSDFMLKKIGLSDRVLVKGAKDLNHISLTLRVLEKIFLVDEARIISSNSPLGTGQYGEKTQELALLRSLITGLDDAEIKELKARRKSKSSLSNEILKLEEFLEKFLSLDGEIDYSEVDNTLGALEESYERIEEELKELISSNSKLVKSRNASLKELEVLHRKKADNDALIIRFKQLKDKYLSDRERLEANSESASYLIKQEEFNCPICGSDMPQDNDFDINKILASNKAEVSKIDANVGGLDKLIEEIFIENESFEKNIYELNSKVEEVDSKLNSELTDKLKTSNKILKDIGIERANYRSQKEAIDRRESVISEIGRLQVEHDAISDEYQVPDFSKEANEFAKIISGILTRWDFPGGRSVSFSNESRDIIIGDSPRAHFGKGMRAICFSAFLLGLMKKLKALDNHPGFVILDSPLTSYKEGDSLEDGDERVADLTYAFYRDLCDNYQDSQIILLDNREPEEDLHSRMKYIHFSRNEKIGRYGFFPVISE